MTSIGSGVRLLLVLILVAGIANIVVSLKSGRRAATRPATGSGMSAEVQKQLAMRLEKQGLNGPAAAAWEAYLAKSDPDSVQSAKIWYRIGKVHQDAGDYEQALTAFYRSESFFKLNELGPEIGRRTQDCLERLGKFAALRYELAQRVGMGDNAQTEGDEIVAEIGGRKISKAELDRKIEAQIERQLAQYAAYLPEEQKNSQKEAMLKRFSSSKERLQLLNQFVMEEILYRKARELKLEDDPDTRALLQDTEQKILAQKVMEKQLAEQIKISPSDVQTFYDARKAEYVQPERAQISHILVPDEEKAQAVLESLKKGEAFEALAKGVSVDEATADKGGAVEGWVEKGAAYVPGLGSLPEAAKLVFETEAGQVAAKPVKGKKGFHVIKVRSREPQRQKTFDEVKQKVFGDLRGRKQREVQEKLFTDLKNQYDVVIHFSRFAGKASEKADKGK